MVSLVQLRVEASLDTQAYTRGAEQKTAADQKMVQSGAAFATSLETGERRLSTSATALERLTRAIDPAYAAQQKFAQGSTTLKRALDAGQVFAEEYARRLEL